MIPRSIPTTALTAGALLLGAAAPGAADAAPSCRALKPTKVKLAAGKAPGRVTVSWRAPRHGHAGLAFRVLRDGAVVGQTRDHRMSVGVAPGDSARIAVVPVLAGKVLTCRTSVVHGNPADVPTSSSAGAVVGLSVRPAGHGRVRLSWDPATAGATPPAGYRVIRNGRTYRRTLKHTMSVRTTKRTARYRVAALDAQHRRGPLSRVVRVKRGHRGPSVPTGAAATIGETTVSLSWGAARGRVASYRVIRDGHVVGAVKGHSIAFPKPPENRPQTYRVVAVDPYGYASRASQPATVTVGHVAPPAPAAPTAGAVTDTSLSLSWSAPAGAGLRGYRVIRDGAVIAQVAGTSMSVGNLAPKSAHDWSIAAVDTAGVVSDPSAPTRVTQADPPPTTGASHAFLLASTDSSFAAFRRQYQQIGVVYPTFFDCDRGTGAILGADNAGIVRFAQDRKVKVLPRYNCQSPDMVHRILAEPGMREAWLSGMVGAADQYGYDGVNVDFEAAGADDRGALTSFIADLSGRLHARGKLLSQAVSAKTADVTNHPRSTAFDYGELAKYDDWVFVMAWGIHWATSAPGPQDDLTWVKQVDDYVATQPLKQKFVIGTMLYGMDWPSGGGTAHPASAFHYPEVQEIGARYGAKPTYDAKLGSWHLAYTDASGVPHDVWYPDAQTIGDRVAMARDRGLGVGLWRLGQEDDRLWNDPRLPSAG